ncbi:MAG: hypothetical protein IKF80_00655 [Erysipelotrichaceae bacterium]|nr:hypothetical protein [Erysipelotrichaceae bacterium]
MKTNNEGKYVWSYDMDMSKNHSILKLVLKIVTGILVLLFLFFVFLAIRDKDWGKFIWAIKILGGCALAIIAICFASYWFVGKYFGGTYSWCYEMDEEGIRYWQPEEQAEKARNIAETSAIVGAATGNLGLAAAGAANSITDENKVNFDQVNFLGKSEAENMITMHTILMHHMIYVNDEDFDFVYNYISQRVKH